MTSNPAWAIAYHSNSSSPRARKWYRVSRVIHVDGAWFELYWHPDTNLRHDNKAYVRKLAKAAGLALLDGTFTDAPAPRTGSELTWSNR